MKKITLLIPCYNEERSIGKVIDSIPKSKLKSLGYTINVLVIDNNSDDGAAEIAKDKGCRVIFEQIKGKGRAISTGFKHILPETKIVVMIDGDNSYDSGEIPRLIEPLDSGFCDVIIGSRLEGKLNGKSMSFSHRISNWFFTFIVRQFYWANVTDTCTGYFAWKAEVVKELNGYIKSKGFAIEAEMITKMAKMGYKIYSVPISYDKREGASKLSPIWDGIKITWMLIKNIGLKPGKREDDFFT